MKFLLKFAVSVALFSSMAFAAEKMDDMALKAHAIECINSFYVEQNIKVSFLSIFIKFQTSNLFCYIVRL